MNRARVKAGAVLAGAVLAWAGAGRAADPVSAFAAARYTQVAGAHGVPLNVVELGDPAQPAVVFIHGYRQSHLSWYAQFGSTLAQRCHLVAYDLRGHGDSGAPWQAAGYDNAAVWADDLAAVLRATEARRPLLVAWSFGGTVAMDHLRLHANAETDNEADVAGLVLVASTGQLLPRAPVPPRAAPRIGLADRAAAIGKGTEAVYGPRVDAAAKSLLAAAAMRASPYLDAAIAARAPTLDNTDLLPRLATLPVTLVNGAADPIVPRAAALQLRAALPTARGVDFAASGHAPFADDAARFNALLEALQCPA